MSRRFLRSSRPGDRSWSGMTRSDVGQALGDASRRTRRCRFAVGWSRSAAMKRLRRSTVGRMPSKLARCGSRINDVPRDRRVPHGIESLARVPATFRSAGHVGATRHEPADERRSRPRSPQLGPRRLIRAARLARRGIAPQSARVAVTHPSSARQDRAGRSVHRARRSAPGRRCAAMVAVAAVTAVVPGQRHAPTGPGPPSFRRLGEVGVRSADGVSAWRRGVLPEPPAGEPPIESLPT